MPMTIGKPPNHTEVTNVESPIILIFKVYLRFKVKISVKKNLYVTFIKNPHFPDPTDSSYGNERENSKFIFVSYIK